MLKANDLSKKIDERLLTAFNRIRKNARNGLAVVKVERDSCGGCHAKIPAQGQFEKVGSWHSLVNEAIFIEKQGGKRKVFIKSEKYPARTTNTEYLNEKEVSFNMEEFDINDYLNKLLEEQSSSEEAEL